MQIGNYAIEQLSEGFFEVFPDRSYQKMNAGRIHSKDEDHSTENYTTALGIDPLLISGYGMNIIIDPGLGWGLDFNSSYKNTSNVVTNLDIFDITPNEIDLVILTHLHFDHVAGSTFLSPGFKTTPTFPNAKYLVSNIEWEYALSQVDSNHSNMDADYNLDELYRLAAENRFDFLTTHSIIVAKGIEIIHTGGHTPGHMIVKISDCGKTAWFPGDLIPTEDHLNHYAVKNTDHDPLQSNKIKSSLLKNALKEDAVMFFYHSLYRKSGRLTKDHQRNYKLIDL